MTLHGRPDRPLSEIPQITRGPSSQRAAKCSRRTHHLRGTNEFRESGREWCYLPHLLPIPTVAARWTSWVINYGQKLIKITTQANSLETDAVDGAFRNIIAWLFSMTEMNCSSGIAFCYFSSPVMMHIHQTAATLGKLYHHHRQLGWKVVATWCEAEWRVITVL